MLNRTYYESRLKEMEETAPAAVICANINDWKFVYDHFGNEESDRLIRTIALLIRESRLKEMEETAPAAVICANINDWKFVYDHFGNEESDRLIRTIALLIRREAQESYVIGRVDGDEFAIVIPNPAEQEAEQFVSRIRNACRLCEDDVLAPSLAL